jgi:hypothetical protein
LYDISLDLPQYMIDIMKLTIKLISTIIEIPEKIPEYIKL